MLRNLLMGAVAGAAGTVALDMTTYADMLVRGRPASQVPAALASKIAQNAGVDLGSRDGGQQAARNRAGGLGALMGYGTGLGIGAIYGLVRPGMRSAPVGLAALVVGAAAMAASDAPAVAMDVTDPASWGVAGWMADVVPHLAYGLVTAAVYDQFASR